MDNQTMKFKFLYIALFAGLSLFLHSCTNEDIPGGKQDLPDGMAAIELAVKVENQQTGGALRSTSTAMALRALPTEPGNKYDNDLNENKIDNVEVFIFNADGTLKRRASNTSGVQKTGDELTTNLRILIPYGEIGQYEGSNFKIVVVANATVSIPTINTLAELRQVIQETTDINKPDTPQQKFLMDGEIESQTITWGNNVVYTVPGELPLRRAASKIRLRVKDININVTENASTVHYEMVGDPQVKLVHYTEKTSLLQNAPYAIQPADWKNAVYRPMVTKTFSDKVNDTDQNNPTNTFLAANVPFYAYENDWSEESEKETYLMVKLTLKAKDASGTYGDEKDYFYRIPVNYRMPVPGMADEEKAGLYKLQRNYLYDIVSSIGILGSEDEDEPIDVAAYVAVQPWNLPDVIDGSIRNAHYLVVKELNPLMPNMETREVGYLSDLPVTVTINKTSYTYYDAQGSKVVYVDNGTNVTITTTKVDGTSSTQTLTYGTTYNGKTITKFDGTTVTADETDPLNKKLVIKHPVPTNYVPFEIDFTVTHVMPATEPGTPLSQKVHVTQYPPKYVTGAKSPGYKPNEGDTGRPYADFRFHNTLGAGGQINDVFYKITTVVNAGTEKIGDPTDANGRTKADAISNQLISPEFIIATQQGMSVAVPQRTDQPPYATSFTFTSGYGPYARPRYISTDPYRRNTTTTNNNYVAYTSAENRCDNYFEGEYGTNGTYTEYYRIEGSTAWQSRQVVKTFKYQGRWRLPTTAELAYIQKIQREPSSAVKYLLEGTNYWTAETGVTFTFTGTGAGEKKTGQTSGNVRCIFDTYKVND